MKRKRARKIATECLGAATQRAGRAVTAHYDRAFADLGLTSTQFTTLTAVRGIGSPPVNTLAESVRTDRTTLTRNLSLMVRNGWVKKATAPSDRRVQTVELTDAGAALLDLALPRWRAAQAQARTALGKINPTKFRDLLGRLERLADARP